MTPLREEAQTRPKGRLPYALTPRTLLLLTAGLVPIALAFFSHSFFVAAAVWDAAVLALAVWDCLQASSPRHVRVSRTWGGVAALGRELCVELTIESNLRAPLRGQVLDNLPPALFPDAPPWLAFAGAPARVRYLFRPAERGDAAMDEVYLRCRGPLGLAERWGIASLPQTVRVYPALHGTGGETWTLAHSRRTEAAIRRLRARGQGREFESLREYREGSDELRDVSWTATARRGVLVAKQYQHERTQPVWLVLDAGRLLRGRVGASSKLDYTAATALAVARLALLAGDRVGLLAYGGRVIQQVLPGRGPGQFRKLMDALAGVRAESGEADHGLASATLGRLQPTRALILWLTDFTETALRPEVVDGAARLLGRHLLLFAVPRQEVLHGMAQARPENLEALYERAAAQNLLLRRELLLRRLRAEGALTVETALDRLEGEVLKRYLDIKERALL